MFSYHTEDYLIKCANKCKLENKLEEAGDLLIRAAKKMKSNDHDTRHTFGDAAYCFKRTNFEKAVYAYNTTISLANENGSFAWSSIYSKQLADVYYRHGDKQEAMDEYMRASHLNTISGYESDGLELLLKAATVLVELDQFAKGAAAFDKVARAQLDNGCHSSTSGYILDAMLCYLADGISMDDATTNHDEYKSLCRDFSSSSIVDVIESLITALTNSDGDEYDSVVASYDELSTINPWRLRLFQKAKIIK
jgi:alpha-soluble NSF attachment protein